MSSFTTLIEALEQHSTEERSLTYIEGKESETTITFKQLHQRALGMLHHYQEQGLKPGDEVTISGPFGEFFAKDTKAEMVFIGGGAGMAPMRSHIFDQLKRLKSERKISFWYGARSKSELFYEAYFEELASQFGNFSFQVALSDAQKEDKWDF